MAGVTLPVLGPSSPRVRVCPQLPVLAKLLSKRVPSKRVEFAKPTAIVFLPHLIVGEVQILAQLATP